MKRTNKELEQLLDKILYDKTYSGGVAYWIEKYDAFVKLSMEGFIAIAKVNAKRLKATTKKVRRP